MSRVHKHIIDRYLSRPDAELDLHGLIIKEAENELLSFLNKAEDLQWKKVRIIVGKGLNSPDGRGVMKEFVEKKLEEAGYVFTRAKLNEGGEGVLIVTFY